jgi:hypothetical protein
VNSHLIAARGIVYEEDLPELFSRLQFRRRKQKGIAGEALSRPCLDQIAPWRKQECKREKKKADALDGSPIILDLRHPPANAIRCCLFH